MADSQNKDAMTLERIAELREWAHGGDCRTGEWDYLLDLAEAALKQPRITREQVENAWMQNPTDSMLGILFFLEILGIEVLPDPPTEVR